MLTAGGPRQEKLGKRSEARGVRPPQKSRFNTTFHHLKYKVLQEGSGLKKAPLDSTLSRSSFYTDTALSLPPSPSLLSLSLSLALSLSRSREREIERECVCEREREGEGGMEVKADYGRQSHAQADARERRSRHTRVHKDAAAART